ncbi:MAG: hypothetical protein V9G20_01295 [Candidatus Promineifilaceae bacterium]
MSELFGDTMRPHYSQSSSTPTYTGTAPTPNTRQLVGNQGWNQSWNREAVLNHNEMMSLAKGQVLVQLKADRLYRLIAERLNPIPRFASLEHPPKTPEFRSRPREYTVGQTRPQARSHSRYPTLFRAYPATYLKAKQATFLLPPTLCPLTQSQEWDMTDFEEGMTLDEHNTN